MVTRRDAPDIGIRTVAELHLASLVVAEVVVDRNANISIVDIAVAVVVAVLGDDESIDDDDGDRGKELALFCCKIPSSFPAVRMTAQEII